MTTKVKGTEGIEFPDSTVQASAAYGKNEFFSGQVLQQRLFTDVGGALPAIIANITQSNKSITPKSTNSTLHIAVSFYGSVVSGGTFINTELHEVGVGTVGATNSHGNTTAGGQQVGGWTQQAIVANAALAARSFQLWGNNATGAGGAVTQMVWSITEVQN